MWPAGRIAPRSFSERPITFDLESVAIFSSSPSVLTSIRRGEAPSPPPPRIFSAASDTLVTERPVARSYQSLAMIPLTAGSAPDRKVQWPGAVTVGKCWKRARVKTAPRSSRRRRPLVYSERKRVR
jgi:hypothetical protein